MTKIETKFRPIKYFVVFVLLFLCAAGTALLYFGLSEIFHKGCSIRSLIAIFFILVLDFALYCLGFSMACSVWKNSPKITIDRYTIKIGSQIFYLKDIKEVTLAGKKPFNYFCYFRTFLDIIPRFSMIPAIVPMEATVLLFNDGTEKIIFDNMHSNSSDIKLFFKQVIINKQNFNPIPNNKISRNLLQFEREEIFKESQIFNLANPEAWVYIINIALFGFITFILSNSLILTGLICMCFFYVFSWTMNYFGLTKEFLVIRKHNLFWIVTIYRLSEIKEIVFEKQDGSPNCLRVISKNLRSEVYKAPTLRKQTWLEMKKRLDEKGVKVRDEMKFY